MTRVREISLVGEEKVYGGKDLPKSEVLSSEWKTREDEWNGDSKDGEDDELPCVIGGESEKDYIWQSRGVQWGVHSADKVVSFVITIGEKRL